MSDQKQILITGILLPIWKTLPQQNSRVFRLQLSNGEKVLARVISAENIRAVAEQLQLKNKLLTHIPQVSLKPLIFPINLLWQGF
ncbi:MAG: hypothetical protein V7K98_10610 [Nostoc sp.]|uniref:hypothetical protein n=1 Tax=Nostoc sp. TaxID=1180 RepID=UPI002FF5A38D